MSIKPAWTCRLDKQPFRTSSHSGQAGGAGTCCCCAGSPAPPDPRRAQRSPPDSSSGPSRCHAVATGRSARRSRTEDRGASGASTHATPARGRRCATAHWFRDLRRSLVTKARRPGCPSRWSPRRPAAGPARSSRATTSSRTKTSATRFGGSARVSVKVPSRLGIAGIESKKAQREPLSFQGVTGARGGARTHDLRLRKRTKRDRQTGVITVFSLEGPMVGGSGPVLASLQESTGIPVNLDTIWTRFLAENRGIIRRETERRARRATPGGNPEGLGVTSHGRTHARADTGSG